MTNVKLYTTRSVENIFLLPDIEKQASSSIHSTLLSQPQTSWKTKTRSPWMLSQKYIKRRVINILSQSCTNNLDILTSHLYENTLHTKTFATAMMNAYAIAVREQKQQNTIIARSKKEQRGHISLYTKCLSAESYLLDSGQKNTSSCSQMTTRASPRCTLECENASGSKVSGILQSCLDTQRPWSTNKKASIWLRIRTTESESW